MKILVGIPAFNEEKNIASVIVKLKKKYQDILVCDDGSNDLTSDIAEQLGVEIIKHEKNLGYGGAISTIFNRAREMQVDVLITFDADGQHSISDIEKVLEPIKDNTADIVIGSRFLQQKNNIPKYRKIGIKAITQLTNITSGTELSDSQSGFRAYNKKIIEKIKLNESGMGISTEILIKSHKLGLKIIEVPISISYEGDTSTHNPLSHGSSVIMSTLKYVALLRPLTFYGIPGMIFLGIGLIFGLWAIQIFSEQGKIITNIALVGIGGVILGTILMITATILYSMVSLVRERGND